MSIQEATKDTLQNVPIKIVETRVHYQRINLIAIFGFCNQRTSNNRSRKRVLIQLEQLELLTLFT